MRLSMIVRAYRDDVGHVISAIVSQSNDVITFWFVLKHVELKAGLISLAIKLHL
jgi:hypothetical protein